MKILTISGSSRIQSSNLKLLRSIELLFPQHNIKCYERIKKLPLFLAEADHAPWPPEVINWRTSVKESDTVIISTPEYIHNIPASIKNALEWLTSSGEMAEKRVLPISFTPHPPRGEKAIQSLTWSLKALKANIVAHLPLYQSEINFDNEGRIKSVEIVKILTEAMVLLES